MAILFISMFAADSFEQGNTIWQHLTSLFLHLIPTFILTALLIIAWKWENLGGLLFIFIGMASNPFIFMLNHNRNHFSIGQSIGIIALINLPFVIIGILFIISHYMLKKNISSSLSKTL
ncbi:hypothetical protein IR213_13935 [Flavobacterium soyangense]|uniref:DUF7670 domain-containing protein n=1 Tax=Flavobacterium soyangense TaxID=2023265 RepID=A0A930UA00_9FLAO|nr:hypothetical protein [Flavobacterium soyangense]MBF2709678.1 hypothetical protein [Flavobacterium soyangense]